MQTKYAFPAVFAPEEEGGYSVYFPDVSGCYTDGDTLTEAIEMAKDALCLMLYHLEEEGKEIPIASDVKAVSANITDNEFVSLIACDTLDYRRYYDNKAVKKTLSIPAWLNALAEREGVNFSAVLQTALKKALGIETKVEF